MASDDTWPELATVDVLGVRCHVLPTDELATLVASAVATRRRLVVGNHNLHSVYLMRSEPGLGRFYERADLVFVDGMSLVVAGRLAGEPLRREHRSTPLDWFEVLLSRIPEGRTVFLLGSKPGFVERTCEVLREKHPHLTFLSHHGYFDAGLGAPENGQILEVVNESGADLLLVGMGMPRQELWLADNLDRLTPPVSLAVGGLFDYYNGGAGTPPRWMGRVGLEWLYRLADDPRRLAFRYLVEPLILLRMVIRERRRR